MWQVDKNHGVSETPALLVLEPEHYDLMIIDDSCSKECRPREADPAEGPEPRPTGSTVYWQRRDRSAMPVWRALGNR
ncbi:unnamed protein product [Boreogadus saida]